MGEYAAKFKSLSRHFRFFREEVDEQFMCHCFQNGLKYEIQDSVLPLGIQHFQVLVEKCREIEDMKNNRANRGGSFSSGGPSRKPGHFAKDCKAPKVEPIVNATRATRHTARGRVYCVDAEAGNPSRNLIQRDCEIVGNTLTALFDSGATHSFIVMDCVIV
ncbi:uncharacterized protein [Cicer arietinum]|uniref:uncharacterized protein n=1 Tax=Cicer arietinum TaxID=3827 RepID=UPI003CC5C4C4